MIELNRKEQCCGCGACAEVCAHKAITMQLDEEGFLYPTTDSSLCNDCGLCNKVCPFANRDEARIPKCVLAVQNRDESVRFKSSSGALFTLLAEQTILDGGVVFGAKFDKDWSVVHASADTIEGCKAFMGSKYVQSRLGSTFRKVQGYLKDGRKVLFSGTPCQVAALRKFLRRDYDNLLVVDVVCHGAPSNKVWQHYLDSVVASSNHTREDIVSISFRDKRNGWRKYGLVISFNDGTEFFELMINNSYMRVFLKDLSIRPSCFECACRDGRSGADLSLADLWGAQKILNKNDDDKGIGLELIWTNKGKDIMRSLAVESESVKYHKAFKYNPAIALSPKRPAIRAEFWRTFNRDGLDSAVAVVIPNIKWSLYQKWLYKLKKSYIKAKLKLRYNEDRNSNPTVVE